MSAEAADARLVQALDALATVQLELDQARVERSDATELLERLLGAMCDAFILADTRGMVARVNDAALRLLGKARGDVEGKPVQHVLGSEVPTSSWRLLQLEASGRLHLELTLPAAAGPTPASVSCSVVRDASGKVVGTLYLGRDLSDTHRLLEEVEVARARWRLLAEIGEELSESVDPEAALPGVCDRLSQATGCGAAVVLVSGALIERVFMDGDSARAGTTVPLAAGQPLEPKTALATVVRTGQAVHASSLPADYPLLQCSGTGDVASAALVPIFGKGTCLGAVLLVAGGANEVDESSTHILEEVARRMGLVLANARLRSSLVELEAAREFARAREEIVAGLSHDMKTPLAVLVGALDILGSADGQIGPDRKQTLYHAMSSQAHRLRRLVLQFLDYTRMESGQGLAVDPAPTDIGGLIRQVVATWDAPSDVQVEISGAVSPVLVDPDRFDQVLSNLFSNAVKFSPAGSPVSITARQSGNHVEVAVTDRGRGIAPKQLANLFDKYYRAPDSTGSTGTGLGLYMSRALLEAQGGSITVASRLGQGSTFTLLLPVAPPEDQAAL